MVTNSIEAQTHFTGEQVFEILIAAKAVKGTRLDFTYHPRTGAPVRALSGTLQAVRVTKAKDATITIKTPYGYRCVNPCKGRVTSLRVTL